MNYEGKYRLAVAAPFAAKSSKIYHESGIGRKPPPLLLLSSTAVWPQLHTGVNNFDPPKWLVCCRSSLPKLLKCIGLQIFKYVASIVNQIKKKERNRKTCCLCSHTSRKIERKNKFRPRPSIRYDSRISASPWAPLQLAQPPSVRRKGAVENEGVERRSKEGATRFTKEGNTS